MKPLGKDEIFDVLSSRYFYSGGSARWMFNYTKSRIDRYLREFCEKAPNRKDILDGTIGPTSSAATNYFFGSSRRGDGSDEYFLVSKRAVQILTESTGAAGFDALYRFADTLQNPSFEGWIVEADLFSQLESARRQSVDFNPRHITQYCAPVKVEAIEAWEHAKNKSRIQLLESATAKQETKKGERKRVRDIASKLVSKVTGNSIACRPTAWNQGGCDVFFVEFAGGTTIQLRFMQVTRGQTHTLNAGYMFSVIEFFENADYSVGAVAKNAGSFALGDVEATKFLETYNLFGANKAKWRGPQGAARYELFPSRSATY